MKIIPFKEDHKKEVSDIIKDALRNYKFDLKGTPSDLIEHDIKIYTPEYIEEYAKKAELFLSASDDETQIYAVAALEKDALNVCYTRSDMQGKGVGRSLISHIEKIAKSRGISKLRVHGNFYTEAFYTFCGFKLIKRTTVNFQGKDWPVVYMEKDL